MLDYFHNSGSLIKTVYAGKRMTDITVFSEFHSLLSVVCCLEPRDVRTSCNIVTGIQLLLHTVKTLPLLVHVLLVLVLLLYEL